MGLALDLALEGPAVLVGAGQHQGPEALPAVALDMDRPLLPGRALLPGGHDVAALQLAGRPVGGAVGGRREGLPGDGVALQGQVQVALAVLARFPLERNSSGRIEDDEIEADYDVRGELGVGDSISPAYSEIRCVVTVETDAPERDVCEMLRIADEHSSYVEMFRQPVRVVRETWFAGPSASSPNQGCAIGYRCARPSSALTGVFIPSALASCGMTHATRPRLIGYDLTSAVKQYTG